MDLYRANIHYIADSYEIYEGGKRLDAGVCNVDIRGIAKQGEIKFVLTGAESFPLASVFHFPFSSPEAELLPDRIAYQKMFVQNGRNEPMVCHLFLKGDELDYIRFAVMGMNGFKLFEFKGRLLEDDDVEDISMKVKSAETVISELRRTGSLTPQGLLDWGEDLYNANSGVETPENVRAIIEAFKLFVEAYKLEMDRMPDGKDEFDDDDNYEEENGDRFSFALPVILKFIALCNYKLNNMTQAGKVAERGLEELEKARNNSLITFDPNSFGKNTLEEIIDLVQKEGQYEPLDEYDDTFDETEMNFDFAEGMLLYFENDDSRAEEISADNFRTLIKRINFSGDVLWKSMKGSDSTITLFQILDTTRDTLYYCWEKLGFGHHSDFWKEGDSMMSYMFIELDPGRNVQNLLNFYTQSSPFRSLDKKDIIRKGIVAFCKETLKRL